MTISRSQMYRQLYQMGGQGIMQLGNGQEEPIFPRLETLSQNLGQAEQTLGQPSDQFNISSITTAITGRPQMNIGGRMGYQEGDMAMMQPEGIMNAMPQEAGGMQQGGGQEQTALLTIIQLLIEQGVPPEQAAELAMQILQVFAQGGQPAVEEFANQLEQEEVQAMASGGIAGYAQRQNYGFGSFVSSIGKAVSGAVKGVASAVKSVAKSPIGQIALAIAAPYAISGLGALATGAGFTGLGSALSGFSTLGGSTFLGGALRAGITNSLIQGITTGKFNPKQALIAAIGGGIAGQVFPQGGAPTAGATGAESALNTLGSTVTPSEVFTSPGTLSSGVIPGEILSPTITPSPMESQYAGPGQFSAPATPTMQQPNLYDKTVMGVRDIGTGLQDFGTNLMKDPMGTIKTGITSLYETTKENIVPLSIGAGLSAFAQQPGETNEAYMRRAQSDPRVAEYITRYGGGVGLRSPGFYSMEKAVDPFAGTSLAISTNPFYPQGYSNGGRTGFEYGSMPLGEPRKNPAGIMELDYRQSGGFVPPIGIKEKADDIPAMLSNNEFVFTANAVRNAGEGDVNKGAQRMYSLMKNLESGGRV